MKKSYLLASLIGVLLVVLVVFLVACLRFGIKKTQPFQIAPFVFAHLDDAYLQVRDAEERGKRRTNELCC